MEDGKKNQAEIQYLMSMRIWKVKKLKCSQSPFQAKLSIL